MLKRLIPLAALCALCACSPAQTREWLRWWHDDPQAAQDWARDECGELCTNDTNNNGIVEPDAAAPSSATSDDAAPSDTSSTSSDEPDQQPGEDRADGAHEQGTGACAQWFGTAISAGWSASDWPTVDRIMYAESRCQPSAYNSTAHFGGHASGLMQIIWPTWAAECGNGDPFDPWFNLHCALYLKEHYGWGQWSTY